MLLVLLGTKSLNPEEALILPQVFTKQHQFLGKGMQVGLNPEFRLFPSGPGPEATLQAPESRYKAAFLPAR